MESGLKNPKSNSAQKIYMYVSGGVSVWGQIKSLPKTGLFDIIWFIVTSDSKMISIESIFSVSFSFIDH